MQIHVRFLAGLEIAFGIIGILCGLAALLLFGTIAALVGWTDGSGEAAVATPILGGAGMLAFFILTLVSLPQIIAGIGLWQEREWGRILSLVICALNLVNVPFGTALGVYGLWVLLSGEGKAYFERRLHGEYGGRVPPSQMRA